MTATAPLPLLLAGTASSAPQHLAQAMEVAWAAQYPGLPCPLPYPLACWTAPHADADAHPKLPLPPGLHSVYWLPTPTSASAQDKAQEQHCRTQLMAYVQAGGMLRVLYGLPQHQYAALWECLQAWQTTACDSGSNTGSAMATTDTAQPHGHAPGLRCRECLDPDSERRLFSRLLPPVSSR
ncbi:MAG: hypothetical protein LBE51_16005 [Acidovorax sp.]|jgi:hypothetical protein|nr:hypothetical protein [Acidovorax sp.]